MEKIPFSQLNLSLKDDVKIVNINNVDVAVRQYIPAEEQLEICANVLRNSADDNNFVTPTKVEVFFSLELLYHFTNIDFVDDIDPVKLFDILESNDVFNIVFNAIPEGLYKSLLDNTTETIENYYKYQNSVLGIFERVNTDYKDLNFDADGIKEKLTTPGNLQLLKDVIDKLG